MKRGRAGSLSLSHRHGCRRVAMLAVISLFAATPAARSAGAQAGLLIMPFGFIDTSGEQRDQKADHEKRLVEMSRRIGTELQDKGLYRVIQPTPGILSCDSRDQECLLSEARKAGTDLILAGAVQKASTLISQIWVGVFDASDGKRILYRQLSFRGDTDEAWQHAADFLLQQIEADPPHKP